MRGLNPDYPLMMSVSIIPICFQGQTAFDVADADILKALEDLKEQQALTMKENPQTNNKKQSSIPKKRYGNSLSLSGYLSVHRCIKSLFVVRCCSVSVNTDNTVAVQESAEICEEETPSKVKKVELEIQSDKEDSSASTNSDVGKFLPPFRVVSSPEIRFTSPHARGGFFFKRSLH